MEDKVIIGTKTFHYEVCIASFLRVNGGAHLKMKSTAKTSYAAAELILSGWILPIIYFTFMPLQNPIYRKTRKLMMSVEGMYLLKKDFAFFI